MTAGMITAKKKLPLIGARWGEFLRQVEAVILVALHANGLAAASKSILSVAHCSGFTTRGRAYESVHILPTERTGYL